VTVPHPDLTTHIRAALATGGASAAWQCLELALAAAPSGD
jgi:hypothetical protein